MYWPGGTSRRQRSRHVEIADTALVGFHRVTGQRLNPQIGLRDDIDVTDATVDHQPFPTVFRGFLGEHVAQQRRRSEPPPSTTSTLPSP